MRISSTRPGGGALAALVLALAALAGCGEGENAAPPTEALHLPETVRVVGHAHECAGEACTRFLLIAPAFEGGHEIRDRDDVRAEIRRGLREAEPEVAVALDAPTTPTLEPQLKSMSDAGQSIVTIRLTRRQ